MVINADFDPNSDRFIRGIIRRKVRQLIGRAGFLQQDFDDLENDLYVRVLRSLRSFNPDKAHLYPFVTTVVERYVATLLRDKQAGKRDHRRITSLNVTITVKDEGPIELSQTIGRRELETRLGQHQRSEEEQTGLAVDLAETIAGFPAEWQQLLALRTTLTMAEIANRMGVPRTTLNDWVRRIRQRFEDVGLRDYL